MTVVFATLINMKKYEEAQKLIGHSEFYDWADFNPEFIHYDREGLRYLEPWLEKRQAKLPLQVALSKAPFVVEPKDMARPWPD